MRRRKWTYTEEYLLLDNYYTKTVRELEKLFPNRSRESINNKIKRLKKAGKITDGKTEEAVKRAYIQRERDPTNEKS